MRFTTALKVGDIFDWDIEEILQSYSIDGAEPGDWDHLLDNKRSDSCYWDVYQSIEQHGFLRPVTGYLICPDYDRLEYGDGHHRLASAIDLGMTTVPTLIVESSHYAIATDSGGWYYGHKVPTLEEVHPWRERVSA
jgi:hypothetical protein